MKKLSFFCISTCIILGLLFPSCNSNQSVQLKTETDTISYILGTFWAINTKGNLKSAPGNELNMDLYLKTYLKAFNQDSITSILGMELQEANEYVNNYFQNAKNFVLLERKAEDSKFIADNARQPGVTTTPSGLQYRVITVGTGEKPKVDDRVKVNYHGAFLNGEVFDSTVNRGEPQELDVSGVIRGLTEGLLLMPVGSKYFFWIPTELGFYDPEHPFCKMLTFEMELLEILEK